MKLMDLALREPVRIGFDHRGPGVGALDIQADGTGVSLIPGTTLPVATLTTAGIMSANDKNRLEGVENTLVTADPVTFQNRAQVTATNIADPQVQHLKTAGFAQAGDGGAALYKRVPSEPGHPGKVQSADGAWWEISEHGYCPQQLGAIADGVTNDAVALADWLTFDALHLPIGTCVTDAPLVSTTTHVLQGSGARLNSSRRLAGSLIEASTPGVSDLLTLESLDPTSQGATDVQGLLLKDLGLCHRGAGFGLRINNIIRSHLKRVFVDCDNDGAYGISFDNWGFFATLTKCYVQRFTNTGIVLGGEGSQHILQDCHVTANNGMAVVGVEARQNDFLISGGQYDVHLPDDTGVGILVNNTSSSINKASGRILNTICETDVAVKITGDTRPFTNVIIREIFVSLGAVSKCVIFDRAVDCLLDNPLIRTPTASGILAEWTNRSIRCGVRCISNAARASLIVDPGAFQPWLHVIGVTIASHFDTLNAHNHPPNLTIIIDHLEGIGRAVRVDGIWRFDQTSGTEVTIAGDTVAVTDKWHILDTEGGAASDELTTLTGGTTGQHLILSAAADDRTVIIRDGVGNISLAGDMTLDSRADTLSLLYDGTQWVETSRSDNAS